MYIILLLICVSVWKSDRRCFAIANKWLVAGVGRTIELIVVLVRVNGDFEAHMDNVSASR